MLASVQTRFGGPDVLSVQQVQAPTPGEHDVLVRVHASPVTQGDRRLRAADYPGLSAIVGRLMFGVFRPRNPTPGTMFAGVVQAVGSGVTRFSVGDRVFGAVDTGAHAELITVAETGGVAHMPEGSTFEQMAALPYGAGTALYFLKDLARVQPGEHVLILGASGGVGRYAIQIAKHLGAEVTAVASAAKRDLVLQLGADHALDYATQDFTRSDTRYDVILDVADASSFGHSRGSLTPNGRYATLYVSVRVLAQSLWTRVFGSKKALFGVAMGGAESKVALAELARQGVIQPVIGGRYPLSQIVAAHAAAQSASTAGDVIVLPARAA